MKIAYFTSLYSKPGSGPSRIAQYLREYDKRLLEITFFTDEKALGLLNEVAIRKFTLLSRLPFYWLFRSLKFYKEFQRRKSGMDLIICSNAFEAFFFAFFKGKTPLAVMINDDNYLFAHQNARKAFKQQTWRKFLSRYVGFFIERWVVQRANLIIVCSGCLQQKVVQKYRKAQGHVKLLYPAVDTHFFRFAPKEPIEKFQILFLKQDWRRGGLEMLVQALGKSELGNKITLQLGGITEKHKKKVLRLVNQSGFKGKVGWLGVLDTEKVREAFYQSDLFILPSRQEAFGISILEAMATGTPVAASRTGGILEVTDSGKAGFLINPDQPEELAQLIDSLLNDPVLLKSKLEYASQYVRQFSKNHLYSSLEAICRSLKKGT